MDFVAANNGLPDGPEAVRALVMAASYMVMGLGDVYLGAPCAVPVDPRCRAQRLAAAHDMMLTQNNIFTCAEHSFRCLLGTNGGHMLANPGISSVLSLMRFLWPYIPGALVSVPSDPERHHIETQLTTGIGWLCQSTTRRARSRPRAPWAWAAPTCAFTPWSRPEVREKGPIVAGKAAVTLHSL